MVCKLEWIKCVVDKKSYVYDSNYQWKTFKTITLIRHIAKYPWMFLIPDDMLVFKKKRIHAMVT